MKKNFNIFLLNIKLDIFKFYVTFKQENVIKQKLLKK